MFWKNKPGFHLACLTETGKVREHNEDNILFDGEFMPAEHQSSELLRRNLARGVLAVFDGMGGEAAGELASFRAASVMADYTAPIVWDEEEIRRLFNAMNEAVVQAKKEGRYGSIGTTATALFLQEKSYLANIGDSPAFLFRDGKLCLISELHTNAKMLEKLGIRRKPALTQCLGIEPEEFSIDPYVRKLDIKRGDRLLLCSDGLTDTVDGEEIARILREEKEAGDAVQRLADAALSGGGADNITVMVCDAQI